MKVKGLIRSMKREKKIKGRMRKDESSENDLSMLHTNMEMSS